MAVLMSFPSPAISTSLSVRGRFTEVVRGFFLLPSCASFCALLRLRSRRTRPLFFFVPFLSALERTRIAAFLFSYYENLSFYSSLPRTTGDNSFFLRAARRVSVRVVAGFLLLYHSGLIFLFPLLARKNYSWARARAFFFSPHSPYLLRRATFPMMCLNQEPNPRIGHHSYDQ